jgi:predicted N-formylglutamate amidohydrolase
MPSGQPTVSLLISCEHATQAVPRPWQPVFKGQQALLDSHRGYDRGSLDVAQALASTFSVPLLAGNTTRLLVDLNRSVDHPRHFSELTRALSAHEKEQIDAEYWWPHWTRYRRYLHELPGCIVHVACHSFTPVLTGKVRTADVGLLYDPDRPREKAWCRALGDSIRRHMPDLRVKMNYPYRGTSNGMGQQHRPGFDDRRLITMELEINQLLCDRDDWSALVSGLVKAVGHTLEQELNA